MPAVTGTLSLALVLDAALTGHPVLRLNLLGVQTIDYGVLLSTTAPVTTGDTLQEVLDATLAEIGVDALRVSTTMRNDAALDAILSSACPTVTEPAESAAMYAFIKNADTALTNYADEFAAVHAAARFGTWASFIKHLMILYVKLGSAQPHLRELTGE